MIDILGQLILVFVLLSILIIFCCICVIALAVLDYTLDSDIKGALVTALGPRHFLKNIHLRFLKLAKKIDTPSDKDIPYGMDGSIWKPDEDYDAEIHRLIEEINNING